MTTKPNENQTLACDLTTISQDVRKEHLSLRHNFLQPHSEFRNYPMDTPFVFWMRKASF